MIGINAAVDQVQKAGINLSKVKIKAIIKTTVIPKGKGEFGVPVTGQFQNIPGSRDTATIIYEKYEESDIDDLIKYLKKRKQPELEKLGNDALAAEKKRVEKEKEMGLQRFKQHQRELHQKEKERQEILKGARPMKNSSKKNRAEPEDQPTFKKLVEAFESNRMFDMKRESQGIMSNRGEHYKFPMITDETLQVIEMDREYINGLNITPDESFPVKNKVSTYADHEIELFGISRNDIDNIFQNARKNNRLIRIASVHGATHSFAMAASLKAWNIPFDFCYYSNLPSEVPGEREYVLYYIRFVLGLPLVVAVPQISDKTKYESTSLEYFTRSRMLPNMRKRWCTMRMKLFPYQDFLISEFYNKLDQGEYLDIVQFLGMQAFQSKGRAALSPKPTPSNLSWPYSYFKYFEAKGAKGKKIYDECGDALVYINWPIKVMVNGKPKVLFTPEERRIDMIDWKTVQPVTLKEWRSVDPETPVMRIFDMLPIHHLSHNEDLEIVENLGAIRNPNEREFGRHGCILCPFADWHYYHNLRKNRPDLYEIAATLRDACGSLQVEEGSKPKGWTWYQFGGKDFKKIMEKSGYTDEKGVYHAYTKDDPPF